jgi:hypothetical protein
VSHKQGRKHHHGQPKKNHPSGIQGNLPSDTSTVDTDALKESQPKQMRAVSLQMAVTLLKWFVKWFFAGLTIFATVVTLYPRVTITVAGPSDDKNPLSASFTISNDGFLPATTIMAMCTLKNLNLGNSANLNIEQNGEQVAFGPKWEVAKLSPGEKMGIPISNCLIVPYESLTDANVGLRVTYRPYPFTFWERHSTSVFQVKSIGAGHFYWYSSPK